MIHRLYVFTERTYWLDILGERGPRQDLVEKAMRIIGESDGPGVIVFVNTMRPNAMAARLGAKIEEPQDADAPLREYGIGAQILRDLGVRKMIFLSDTKPQKLAGLDGYGLSIEGWQPLNRDDKK